jgi:hypothetical protein
MDDEPHGTAAASDARPGNRGERYRTLIAVTFIAVTFTMAVGAVVGSSRDGGIRVDLASGFAEDRLRFAEDTGESHYPSKAACRRGPR